MFPESVPESIGHMGRTRLDSWQVNLATGPDFDPILDPLR
jgi:hypothetical protein